MSILNEKLIVITSDDGDEDVVVAVFDSPASSRDFLNRPLAEGRKYVPDGEYINLETKLLTSELVMKYFSENIVNFESIATFLINFQLELLQVGRNNLGEENAELIFVLKLMSKIMIKNLVNFSQTFISQIIDENENIIVDIFNDLGLEKQGRLTPLIDWDKMRRNKNFNYSSFAKVINELSNFLYLALGIQPQEQSFNTYKLVNLIQ